MDHSIIPVAWKKTLSTLQMLHPSAIIAGGALRDTICDAQVKDIDIFINDNEVADIEKIAKLFGVEVIADSDVPTKKDHIRLMHDFKAKKEEAGKKYEKIDPRYIHQEPNSAMAALQSYITSIYDMKLNGELYQLIFVEIDPIGFIEFDFDFGLCKVYFDGRQLTVTDEFWYDYEHKQLTISGHHSASQLLHTLLTHRVNLASKYPNWKVVVDSNLRLRTEDEMPPSYKALQEKYEAEQTKKAIEKELQTQFQSGGGAASYNPSQGVPPWHSTSPAISVQDIKVYDWETFQDIEDDWEYKEYGHKAKKAAFLEGNYRTHEDHINYLVKRYDQAKADNNLVLADYIEGLIVDLDEVHYNKDKI